MFMDVHGISWKCMDLLGFSIEGGWVTEDGGGRNGDPGIQDVMDSHGYSWISINCQGCSRMSMDSHGCSVIFMDVGPGPLIFIDVHGISWIWARIH